MSRILAIFSILSAAAVCTAQAPKLGFESNDLWIGILPADTVVTLKVPVRNDGKVPLEIYRVNRTCSCTEVRYPTVIAPVSTDTVTLTVNTAKIETGHFCKHLTFVSNDPEYTRRFYYSGEIMPDE